MANTTISSHQFNQDPSHAKKATQDGVVFITDHGRPTHVLMTFAEYQRLTHGMASIIDMLAMPGVEDVDFDVPRTGFTSKPSNLS